ncbi:hypothetical protein C8R46DRAFT_419340 [Mycena filopes]|nr:hypothetical protein C8R46DRAFT_419340 [Mycena filopes]
MCILWRARAFQSPSPGTPSPRCPDQRRLPCLREAGAFTTIRTPPTSSSEDRSAKTKRYELWGRPSRAPRHVGTSAFELGGSVFVLVLSSRSPVAFVRFSAFGVRTPRPQAPHAHRHSIPRFVLDSRRREGSRSQAPRRRGTRRPHGNPSEPTEVPANVPEHRIQPHTQTRKFCKHTPRETQPPASSVYPLKSQHGIPLASASFSSLTWSQLQLYPSDSLYSHIAFVSVCLLPCCCRSNTGCSTCCIRIQNL